MSIDKSIGWTDMTLNPIRGRCKGECWYCYYSGKGGILNRFKQDPKIRLDLTVFDNLPKKPKKIFLCSTHDLFGDWISDTKRQLIFKKIRYLPQHTFQILTKYPQNIDREMPNNVWLGVTITIGDELYKIFKLKKAKANIKFISFEPIMGNLPIWWGAFKGINWIIIGKLTGFGRKYDVSNHIFKRRIAQIFREAERHNIPIFLKDNLKEIWGDELIQEFPR